MKKLSISIEFNEKSPEECGVTCPFLRVASDCYFYSKANEIGYHDYICTLFHERVGDYRKSNCKRCYNCCEATNQGEEHADN